MNQQQTTAAAENTGSADDLSRREREALQLREGIEEFERLVRRLSVVAVRILKLARLESRLAIRQVPVAFRWLLTLIPLLILTWVSFSTLISWALYDWTSNPTLGALTFFLMQGMATLWVLHRLHVAMHRMAFRNTLKHLKALRLTLVRHESSSIG